MKLILILTSLALMLAVALNCPGAEWTPDYDYAMRVAKQQNKAVLLDFTGSDWCGWCMKLKREVFDQGEFGSFADANLVLVEVDFPHHTGQSESLKEQNQNLAQRFGIRGFPTIIVLNSSGEQIGKTGYHEGGPKAFIEELERMPGISKNGRSADPRDTRPDPAPRHDPKFVPIKPTVPIHYGELALKGVSGPANRRMALINNENFLVGDTAKVKVKDTKVQVTCKEIHEDSVVVVVDGKNVELKLAHQ